MAFPLADWIDGHRHLPHNLGASGMVGALASPLRSLRRPMAPDPVSLRRELAQSVGVRTRRLFLTHGATEANTAALLYLAARARAVGVRRPAARLPCPEYPPLREAARWVGFRDAPPTGRAAVGVLSDPNNPTGRRGPKDLPVAWAERCDSLLIDETFREFTRARTRSRAGRRGLWTTGTFTKVYGADGLRVGFVVAPPEEVERFAEFHGVLLDSLPEASVAGARTLLRDRATILGEARSLFRSNLAALESAVGECALDAPVWFDRAVPRRSSDGWARRLAARGILVCPGSMFGDPTGVRVCLTQRSFPRDLAAYLEATGRGRGV